MLFRSLGIATALYFAWFLFWQPSGGGAVARDSGPRMPEHVTPFTVLSVLQQVGARARLDDAAKQALAADIARIEACHFGRAADPDLDLKAIAARWLRTVG